MQLLEERINEVLYQDLIGSACKALEEDGLAERTIGYVSDGRFEIVMPYIPGY